MLRGQKGTASPSHTKSITMCQQQAQELQDLQEQEEHGLGGPGVLTQQQEEAPSSASKNAGKVSRHSPQAEGTFLSAIRTKIQLQEESAKMDPGGHVLEASRLHRWQCRHPMSECQF